MLRNNSTMNGSLRDPMSCSWAWLNKSSRPKNRRYGIYLLPSSFTIHTTHLADLVPMERLALSPQFSFVECQPRQGNRLARRSRKSCSCYYSRPKRWPLDTNCSNVCRARIYHWSGIRSVMLWLKLPDSIRMMVREGGMAKAENIRILLLTFRTI